MPPVISIVGKSGSGKTTLLEKLIAELHRRGHEVAVIKHSRGFELDHEGKDTWRFRKAGACAVIIASPEQLGLIKSYSREPGPGELAGLVGPECDLVLAEGFKGSALPKIEIVNGDKPLCPADELLAIVAEKPVIPGPVHFTPDDIKGLADFVEKSAESAAGPEVELFVNGAPVPLEPPIRDLVWRTVTAMVAGLKGTNHVESMRVSIRR